MVALMVLVSKTGYIGSPGGFNCINERLGSNNKNGYSRPLHNKFGFPCIFLILFLYIKCPPMHMISTLEISLFLLSIFIFII